MWSLGFDRIRTVLCLGAHSDDIEIGCGGTIIRMIAKQPDVRVHWVVFSAAGERRAEAEKSASLFLAGAASQVRILDFPDRYFPDAWKEIKLAFDEIRGAVNPDLVFTHRREDAHQDHRLLSELTWNAFRDHGILEYEIPKFEGDLDRPNVYVPLPASVLDRKLDYLHEAFVSQRDKPWFRPESFAGLAYVRGLECRAADGVAEAFHGRKLVF